MTLNVEVIAGELLSLEGLVSSLVGDVTDIAGGVDGEFNVDPHRWIFGVREMLLLLLKLPASGEEGVDSGDLSIYWFFFFLLFLWEIECLTSKMVLCFSCALPKSSKKHDKMSPFDVWSEMNEQDEFNQHSTGISVIYNWPTKR